MCCLQMHRLFHVILYNFFMVFHWISDVFQHGFRGCFSTVFSCGELRQSCLPNRSQVNIFCQNCTKRWSTLSRPEHPGADLGAIWRRKRSKDAFSSIWGRFFVDFRRILEGFWTILDRCLIISSFKCSFRRCLLPLFLLSRFSVATMLPQSATITGEHANVLRSCGLAVCAARDESAPCLPAHQCVLGRWPYVS